jgi:hypothetical protein
MREGRPQMIKEKECAVEGCQEFPATGFDWFDGKALGVCPTCYNKIKIAIGKWN